MSEWWETPETNNPQEPAEPSVPSEPSVPTEPTAPETPATPTPVTAPTPPETPAAPDRRGDPSVPFAPQPPATPPVQPPVQPNRPPMWTPPASTTPNMWPPRPAAPTPAPAPYPPQPPKKSGRGATIIAVSLLSALCVLLLAIGAILLLDRPSASNTPGGTTNPTSSSRSDTTSVNENAPSVTIQEADADDGGLTTTEIVQRNLDSTVVINMYKTSTVQYGGFTFNTDTESETLAGTASGIVMSEDGYIITNQHVAVDENSGQAYRRIEVVLYNGATYTAELVGADEDTDLAVIKISATGLKPATFGSSSKMSIGDRVVTLGNAGGLEWSASQGILSGTKRDVYDKTGYSIQCLQIDAAINPGNSGGPLINAQGQVIGINSAKIVYTGYESLGFSIPIDEAKPILDDLIRYGYVTGRVELGIKGYSITQTGYEGFMVSEIDPDSSLAGADIKVYDIITALDGETVTNRTELRNLLSKHKVGDTVTLSILRITNQRTGATERFEAKVTLRESRG